MCKGASLIRQAFMDRCRWTIRVVDRLTRRWFLLMPKVWPWMPIRMVAYKMEADLWLEVLVMVGEMIRRWRGRLEMPWIGLMSWNISWRREMPWMVEEALLQNCRQLAFWECCSLPFLLLFCLSELLPLAQLGCPFCCLITWDHFGFSQVVCAARDLWTFSQTFLFLKCGPNATVKSVTVLLIKYSDLPSSMLVHTYNNLEYIFERANNVAVQRVRDFHFRIPKFRGSDKVVTFLYT